MNLLSKVTRTRPSGLGQRPVRRGLLAAHVAAASWPQTLFVRRPKGRLLESCARGATHGPGIAEFATVQRRRWLCFGVVVAALTVLHCSKSSSPSGEATGDAAAGGALGQEKSAVFTSAKDFKKGELAGLTADAEGDLRMSSGLALFDTPYIWIPSSTERTVSKIDTKTQKLIGTYPLVSKAGIDCYNPSRTTVDMMGNVWVGCRGDDSYKHRAEVTAAMVPVTVDNKVVKLSQKTGEVLLSIKVGQAPRALALDADNVLWIGCSVDDTVWAIDGDSGACLYGEDASCKHPAIAVSDFPYGAAVDQRGHLWVMSKALARHPNVVSEIDTKTGVKLGEYGPYYRKDPATKATTCETLYGIAIDQMNNIWLGGCDCDDVVKVKGVAGENPTDGRTYAAGEMIGSYDAGGRRSRGLAIDGDGNVWVALSDTNTACKLKNTDGSILATVNVGQEPIGVGIDAWGNAWVVNRNSDSVHRINGLLEGKELAEIKEVAVGKGPYTYSDMLGMALRTITQRSKGFAYWMGEVDAQTETPNWARLTFEATTPGGSSIRVRTRCAAKQTELATAPWGPFAQAAPAAISGCTNKRWLQFEVRFETESAQSAATPVLHHLTVFWK